MDPLLIFGALLLLIGLVGGGFELEKVKVPKVSAVPRVICGALGTGILLYWGARDAGILVRQTPTPAAAGQPSVTVTDVLAPVATSTLPAQAQTEPAPISADRSPTSTSPVSHPTESSATADLFKIKVGDPCLPRVLPTSLDPRRDPVAAADAMREIRRRGEWWKMPIIPAGVLGDQLDPSALFASIWSTVPGKETIRLGNKVSISVQVNRSIALRDIDAAYDFTCGGGGEPKIFPEVSLDSSANQTDYSTVVTHEKYQFFTLAPGEEEEFVFPLRCNGVGYYSLDIRVPYDLPNRSGEVHLPDVPQLACPSEVTLWAYGPLIWESPPGSRPLFREGSFVFEDGEYRVRKESETAAGR